ncbi:MAG: GtrA family protein [Bordetella sp.]|uniref:GtrA family protein n=1 Tax=Bordetella sp. TaxID=28081 RepID=UPI003F7C5E0E
MNDKLIQALSNISLRQIFSFVLIGVLTNLIGYGIYILLTYYGVTPKFTVTILYPIGATIGFFANRRFTFQHNGRMGVAGVRYLVVQILGYLLNIFMLAFFVDKLGFPHQIIEAFAIAVVAIFLFVSSRLFVFI